MELLSHLQDEAHNNVHEEMLEDPVELLSHLRNEAHDKVHE